MKPYSQDLRQRVLAASDRGLARAELIATFQVSDATIKRWLARRRQTGAVAVRPIPGRPSRKGAALVAAFGPQLQAHPDATLAEHCRLWAADHEPVSTATMSRVIRRHFGWSFKKRRSRQPNGTKPLGPSSGTGVPLGQPPTSWSSTRPPPTAI